jgi:hypothetical protein
MEQPDNEQFPALPELIAVALDREQLAPETLLVMCGLTRDEIADELAELTELSKPEKPSEAELALELTAFRVAEVLDTISTQVKDEALKELGKKFLLDLVFMTLQQVAMEQKAVVRHENKELDHNCEAESCPMSFIQVEPSNASYGIAYSTRLDTAELFESDEW